MFLFDYRGLCEISRTCDNEHFYICPLLFGAGKILAKAVERWQQQHLHLSSLLPLVVIFGEKNQQFAKSLKTSFGMIDE